MENKKPPPLNPETETIKKIKTRGKICIPEEINQKKETFFEKEVQWRMTQESDEGKGSCRNKT